MTDTDGDWVEWIWFCNPAAFLNWEWVVFSGVLGGTVSTLLQDRLDFALEKLPLLDDVFTTRCCLLELAAKTPRYVVDLRTQLRPAKSILEAEHYPSRQTPKRRRCG